MKLNLGSYLYPLPGFVNVDIRDWTGTELIVDLNRLPWPWKDGSIEYVRAVDILEHLGKLTKQEIVGELARITKPGGKILVRVPCVNHPWALASLQHAHAFQYNSFEESYAQPWFESEIVYVRLGDSRIGFRWNRFWRLICKWTRFVFTITFELTRKNDMEGK